VAVAPTRAGIRRPAATGAIPPLSGAAIELHIGKRAAARGAAAKAIAIAKPGKYGGLAWVDNTHLVFDGQSADFKNYFIYLADAATGNTKTIHEIHEEKFWSIPDWGEAGAQPWPSPNGKWIAFLSDQDGWDHLFVMPASGGNAVQITKGKFEAWRPAWSHDSTRIAFDANLEDRPGDRVLGIAKIGDDPGHADAHPQDRPRVGSAAREHLVQASPDLLHHHVRVAGGGPVERVVGPRQPGHGQVEQLDPGPRLADVDPDDVAELDRRIWHILDEYVATDGDRQNEPLLSGLFVLHRPYLP